MLTISFQKEALIVTPGSTPQLRRVLRLHDFIFYGIVILHPTAPVRALGVVSRAARGVVMLFTTIGYGPAIPGAFRRGAPALLS